jgi:hypothetical protein
VFLDLLEGLKVSTVPGVARTDNRAETSRLLIDLFTSKTRASESLIAAICPKIANTSEPLIIFWENISDISVLDLAAKLPGNYQLVCWQSDAAFPRDQINLIPARLSQRIDVPIP